MFFKSEPEPERPDMGDVVRTKMQPLQRSIGHLLSTGRLQISRFDLQCSSQEGQTQGPALLPLWSDPAKRKHKENELFPSVDLRDDAAKREGSELTV